MNAAAYYRDLTCQYRHYGGEAHGWHYGLWDRGAGSHVDALLRSNERLLAGVNVGPATRILDVGFGDGGFAVWAAREHGAQVTGISVCRDHVPLARALAARHGVGDRCRFLVMDMDALGFADNRFDVVVNQETGCYARDKGRYLAEVRRVLAPGGLWRSLDFSIRADVLAGADQRYYRDVCEGFHIPSLASLPAWASLLRAAGMEVIDSVDLTRSVLPTAASIRRLCYLPRLLRHLHLDWMIYSRDAGRRANRQGHILAALRYSQGLERGVFRYAYFSARKPGQVGQ